MANLEHLKKLKESVEAWNKWREENPEIIPDLREAYLTGVDIRRANLSKADLHGAYLSWADLSEANLSEANISKGSLIETHLNGANLSRANLKEAQLSGTHLSEADFSGANLSEADLRRANLSGADLRWTNLIWTYLAGANFAGCLVGGTIFANADLRQAIGLDAVRHGGPSSIGIDTIYASQGKIPEIFLRGVGVGDELIAFIRAMGGAIQFYSCFISYSGKDQLFAERLYEALQARGVRCWFAPHHVQGGKKLHEQINDAIRVHERLLLILSPDSINSEWVKTEIAKARKREVNEKRQILFPVMLKLSYEELKKWEFFDADIGKDSAREIREYYIPDFTEWESAEKFKEEFEKLVRDLKKAEEAKKAAGA